MFDFLKCLVVKTKYDECKTNDKSTQCDLFVQRYDVEVQCGVSMFDKYCQCDLEKQTSTVGITPLSTPPSRLGRKIFLRDKALRNIPFEVYEDNGDKYIIIKGESVFLQHIKGYFKYDEPWNFK